MIGERKKLCSAKLKKKKKKQLGVSRESERVRLFSRVSIKSPFGVLQYRRQMSELCHSRNRISNWLPVHKVKISGFGSSLKRNAEFRELDRSVNQGRDSSSLQKQ